MEDKAKRMMVLKNDSNFDHFSRLIQLPGLGTQFSSNGIMDFESRKSTYNSLLEAIKDGKSKIVGLYGMGGLGKTTLAIEVSKKVEQLKLFDKVIKVVVSRTVDVKSIQEEVKGLTGLKFDEPTESATAQRLLIGLKSMKILVILDDVWSKLDLQKIGIPLNENCCILLTTRLRDVCVSMDCDENIIELFLLTDDEAWELLKMHANRTNVSNEFDTIGRKIVDQCKGLPIAIVTVGRSLRGKGIVEWELALRRLQHSLPLDIDESSRGPYVCLELSYKNLPSRLVQLLFLLCAMFPEDHRIHIEDLIRFAKGALDSEEIGYTMEGARIEILACTNTLLDSCLLMHTDGEAFVKMHDLVRDVALWIAKKQLRAILVDSPEISKMMVEDGNLEKTKVISLWNLEDNFKLSNQLCCSALEILLLHPEGFIENFGGIRALKVLAPVTSSSQWLYRRHRIQWSPQSTVSSLVNLHTICLRGIVLGDISFLCQLKRLEILDLRMSRFNELPAEIEHMQTLKLLDVFKCDIEISPLGVIEKCKQLEELYFWDYKSAIQQNFSLPGLKRYVIYDSRRSFAEYEAPFLQYFDDECIKALRALCIQSFEVSALNELNPSMKDLISRANYLWLENCSWDYEDISSGIKHLVVSCCPKRRFIVDNNVDASRPQTGQKVFSDLITLRLMEMNGLEQVFSQDSSVICSLSKLQGLFIYTCRKLTTIFTHAIVACHCPLLKELEIRDCPRVYRLVAEEARVNRYGNEIVNAFVVVKADSFNHLRNQKLLTLFLSLEVVRIGHSGRRMKGMFEVQVTRGSEESLNSQLCVLELSHLEALEYIWNGPKQSLSLHRLKDVALTECPKLRNIFTLAIVTSLPELRSLRVSICDAWEGIFCEESLVNLSSSSSSSNVCFPKLENIKIHRCNKVKCLFPYSIASRCPSLEGIKIEHCCAIEGVVQGCEGEVGDQEKLFPRLKDLSLNNLPNLRYIYQGYEFNTLSDTTHIQDCPDIQNIPPLE